MLNDRIGSRDRAERPRRRRHHGEPVGHRPDRAARGLSAGDLVGARGGAPPRGPRSSSRSAWRRPPAAVGRRDSTASAPPEPTDASVTAAGAEPGGRCSAPPARSTTPARWSPPTSSRPRASSPVAPGPAVLWAHNDSGGGAEVFAVGLDGVRPGPGRARRCRRRRLGGHRPRSPAPTVGPTGCWSPTSATTRAAARGDRPVRLHRIDEPAAPGPGAIGSAGPGHLGRPRPTPTGPVTPRPCSPIRSPATCSWCPSSGTARGRGCTVVPAAAVVGSPAPAPVTMERVAHGGRHRGPPGDGRRRVGRRPGRGPAHLHRRDRVGARPVGARWPRR